MNTSNKQDQQQQTSTPATTMIRTDHKTEDAQLQQQSTETCIIPQHSDDTETKDFYFKHGLRYVKPYYFDYKSHAKGRWVGMTALQMYLKEFSYYTDEYVRRAIELSRITINGQKITADRVIRPNELLCHRLHRHELPILNTSVNIIPCDNEGIIVVDKPASLPVHPCGRYRKNSLTYLLQNESIMVSRKNKSDDGKSNDDDGDEQNEGELYPIHRLDRITSGILIISKTKEYSQQLTAQMTRNEIKKVYVAIVSGKWSLSDHSANSNDDTSSSSSSSRDTGVNGDQMTENKVYECDTKIWAKDRRCGIWEANDTMGKYTAKTCFSLVAYDPVNDLSLLLCRPITGRTHQIRVHLQSLGHPIANDPCYGFDAERVRTDRKRKIEETKQNSAAKRQKTSENGGDGLSVQSEMPGVETIDFKTVQVETGNANIKENRNRKQRVHKEYEKRSDKSNQTNEQSTHENREEENQKEASTSENVDATPASTSSPPPPTYDPMCKECIEESIHPVEPHELYLYLHSWVYINPGVWNVKSDLPFWLHNCFPDVNLERMNSSLGHLLESTAHLNKESVFTQEE